MKRLSQRKLLLILGDIGLIGVSMLLAFSISLDRRVSFFDLEQRSLSIIFLFLALPASFYIFDLYNIRLEFRWVRILILIALALVLVFLGSAILFYATPPSLSRLEFIIGLAFTGALGTLWRFLFSRFFSLAVSPRNVLIVGTGHQAKRISSPVSYTHLTLPTILRV